MTTSRAASVQVPQYVDVAAELTVPADAAAGSHPPVASILHQDHVARPAAVHAEVLRLTVVCSARSTQTKCTLQLSPKLLHHSLRLSFEIRPNDRWIYVFRFEISDSFRFIHKFKYCSMLIAPNCNLSRPSPAT